MKIRSSSSWATIVSVGPVAAWLILVSAEARCCPAPATKSGTSSMNDLRLEIPDLLRVSIPDASPAGDVLAWPPRAPRVFRCRPGTAAGDAAPRTRPLACRATAGVPGQHHSGWLARNGRAGRISQAAHIGADCLFA